MKTQAPTTTSEPPTTKPTVRPWVLVVAALAAGFLLYSKLQSHHAQASTSQQKQGASTWLKEVDRQLQRVSCGYVDEAALDAHLRQLPRNARIWEEKARIEPSESLRALIRLRETLACKRAQKQNAHQQLSAIQGRLSESFEQSLRSWHARLVRAKRLGDTASQERALLALRNLLSWHEGPLRDQLDTMVRNLQAR